ncbi:Exocyst complex component EXO70B1 like [Actinidia chinensis var. chinensis]|uniref:Exocyst subunit Exo70 family protein n=1 Tax=Actinidia chinensis var. chinensis TaxID=1590841 RepID=A0A2R6QGE5_ACTCC|nr:Exocyst complex component EXO70B1 like [Actinidia chinensis var. chinensis]
MAATIEEEDKVMATAKKIVESLNTSKEDMILIFSRFDNRLSNITSLISGGDCKKRADEDDDDPLVAAEKVILRWESDRSESSRLWEESPDEAAEYLAAVDELLKLTEDSSDEDEDRDRAEIAIQLAMSRLEDEFRHILIRNTVPLDADRLYGSIRRVSLSFASHDGEIEDFESFGEEIEGYCHERGASLGDDLCVDLVHPDAVVELKEIADRMIRAKYEKECCQVYSSVRRDVIDECLSILGVEKLSIEEVQRIEWRSLDEKMKKWVQSVKVGVRVLLAGEKRLCEHMFEDSELIQEVCFMETAKGCVMQLLNFGEAVAIGRRSSEKLFRILDMYDVLVNVLPDLELLFGGESGKVLCSEARGVMDGLGLAAIGTFVEFENAVQGEASRKPIQGGEIHPLTRYVMNYVKLLVDYSDSLNALLENSVDDSGDSQRDDGDLPAECTSPFARRLLSLIKSLESNLEEKSRMYEDGAMQYVFLMNNILYIVQKVKDSELGKLLGDHWVRKRRGQIRQYATSYLRASWTKVLSCLKDEGIGGSTSNASKVALKERFKNFNTCFEEIYRIQTAWKVPDPQLREELRISISEKVIPAYRSFMGRFGNHLDSGRHPGKYIKYTPEDLENYLSDLFEGTPGVLNHMRRKST